MKLYDYQRDALNQLKSGDILFGMMGTGKSAVALAYYVQEESPKPVYVITTAKKRDSTDWESEANQFQILTVAPCIHGQLVVDSWNNISKYADVKDSFFIFDEQRVVGSGAWVNSFLTIAKNNNWILLSATPGDAWIDYVPVFIANGFFKNRTHFVKEHCYVSHNSRYSTILGYKGEDRLRELRDQVLVTMHGTRDIPKTYETTLVSYDRAKYREVQQRWNPYKNAPSRDISETISAMRRVVYSDPSRVTALMRIWGRHKRLIVFYNFNYELDILRDAFTGVCPVGEWNGHNHDDIPEGPEWIYLVQYTAGAEGWNCVETDAMCFYSMTYSYKQYLQAQGRIDRMNTGFGMLYYYVLQSGAWIEKAIMRSITEKRDFNLAAIKGAVVR